MPGTRIPDQFANSCFSRLLQPSCVRCRTSAARLTATQPCLLTWQVATDGTVDAAIHATHPGRQGREKNLDTGMAASWHHPLQGCQTTHSTAPSASKAPLAAKQRQCHERSRSTAPNSRSHPPPPPQQPVLTANAFHRDARPRLVLPATTTTTLLQRHPLPGHTPHPSPPCVLHPTSASNHALQNPATLHNDTLLLLPHLSRPHWGPSHTGSQTHSARPCDPFPALHTPHAATGSEQATPFTSTAQGPRTQTEA